MPGRDGVQAAPVRPSCQRDRGRVLFDETNPPGLGRLRGRRRLGNRGAVHAQQTSRPETITSASPGEGRPATRRLEKSLPPTRFQATRRSRELVRNVRTGPSEDGRPSSSFTLGSHLFEETNPQAKGRVSTDRSVETALPSTTPRQVRKSSADNSEFRHRACTHDRPPEAGRRSAKDPAAVPSPRAAMGPVRRPSQAAAA